jgi:hypothetical protein
MPITFDQVITLAETDDFCERTARIDVEGDLILHDSADGNIICIGKDELVDFHEKLGQLILSVQPGAAPKAGR